MSQPVIVEEKNHQLWLTLNRPDDQNRIDREAMEVLTSQLASIDDRPDVRVVVLTGSDEYFCSGGRVDPTSTDREKAAYSRAITHMHEQLAQVRPPVVAAVSGHCRAGGMAILAGADVALAAADVRFGFPEINHGGFPVMAMATALPLLPPKIAFDLFYTGRDLDAAEAQALGLVSRVVARDEFARAVADYVAEIADRDPRMMAIGRAAFYGMAEMAPVSRMAFGREVLKSVLKA